MALAEVDICNSQVNLSTLNFRKGGG